MAEGRLTLSQAKKLYREMDIKEPSSEAMRSAVKVFGKDNEEKEKELADSKKVICDLSGALEISNLKNEKLELRLTTSERKRRMLRQNAEQGIEKDALDREKKEKFVKEVRMYTKKIKQATGEFKASLK